jgi:hypothetical protein
MNIEKYEVVVPEMALAPAFSVDSFAAASVGTGLAGVSWDVLRPIVGKIVWAWFEQHKADSVVHLVTKIWFIPINFTVKVKDCAWLLTALFGPAGANTVTSRAGNVVFN